MTKKLEEILLNVKNVSVLTEEQTKETLKTVLGEETAKFLKESLYEDDEVASDNVQVDGEYDEEIVGGSGTEGDEDMGMSPETDDVSLDSDVSLDNSEMSSDSVDTVDPSIDTMTTSEDEVLDLSNASFDEVMAALENLPDDTVIEIKKNPPTFDVSAEADSELNESEEEDCDDCLEESEKDELDEWIEESLKESIQKDTLLEYKTIISDYESKLQKLQEQLNKSNKQIQTLTEEKQKYANILNESETVLEKLALYNTNLMHVTKLFTEQALTRNERGDILKQFDDVKTINESKVLYNALNKTLGKSKSIMTENIETIKEEIKTQKSEKEKPILKEEKTYINPVLARFDQLVKHKI